MVFDFPLDEFLEEELELLEETLNLAFIGGESEQQEDEKEEETL